MRQVFQLPQIVANDFQHVLRLQNQYGYHKSISEKRLFEGLFKLLIDG